MDNHIYKLGENIRNTRKEKGLSQLKLSDLCSIKDSTLSLYENGKKFPNLDTCARIAKALEVSIDQLYYGDENTSFMPSEIDNTKKTIYALYHLWDTGLIEYDEYLYDASPVRSNGNHKSFGFFLEIKKYPEIIKRLFSQLNDYKKNIMTYDNPDDQLKSILSSAAASIDIEEASRIKREKDIENIILTSK